MPTIVIADDFSAVRSALCQYFETAKIARCLQASDGQEALLLALDTDPDVVILDYSMPIMNGLKAAKVIRRLRPATAIFLISAHGNALQKVADDSISGAFCKGDLRGLVTAVKAKLEHD